ncbi:S26 family signal peptidase [Nocardioides coralli]|uniref:S26 family signal peptidase n=1 Tax=Nocardioides coralli TaxID=2872154 RepID=UPI001CA41CE0|nr:S26 family signal peptidase [Nocardioides coralli]QZY30477.1 S26 family signal peptidase [Nocardioides coralli]
MARAPRVAAAGLLAALLLVVLVAVGWRVAGGTWVRVETPSMGTTAPVGSLLWLRPTTTVDLEPGDIVTFRAPGESGTTTRSHHVDEVLADDTLTTRGVLSGEDPWTVTEGDLVGRVVAVWVGAGWVVLMAPTLVVGAVAVAVGVRRARTDLRLPLAVVGASLVLTTALVVHRPLAGAEQLAFRADGDVARATWVNTGMLPLRLAETGGGAFAVMHPGEVAEVVDRRAEGGRFEVEIEPVLSWWWWMCLSALCFVPALVETGRRLRGVSARPR